MKGSTITGLMAGMLFLIAPTIFIAFPLLSYVSEHYSLLFIDQYYLLGLFSAGLIIAYILHGTRLRFLLTFALLLGGLYAIYQSISVFPFTEFDAYYISNRFRISATIFVVGWFSGFGISRWRYFLIFYALGLMALSGVTLSTIGEHDIDRLVWLFAPPVIYTFYILFSKELLLNLRYQSKVNFGQLMARFAGFSLLILFAFWLTTQLLQSKFQEIEEQIAGNSQNDQNDQSQNSNDDSMLEKDGENFFRLKDYTELRPRLRQSEELLFCAYIDNFIGEGIPNPQYITLYHLNQYNVDLERFEVDPGGPANDLYLPDPTEIPNYFIHSDSTVLESDLMEQDYKPVQSTMYINQLSPDIFVAPSTAFSCQPISVEEEFQDQYKFAYNVYSQVSTLNSAYFVYNARDSALRAFQKQRYDILRRSGVYENEDSSFMEYYTRIPEGETFQAIADLADSITRDAETTIDKVISIRDYFLSKKDNGEPLFTYTLIPGSPTDPNIPDASLLHNFLFNTQKGYCTYFATATLFMLRSQGIPVRLSAGFMTVDRSHNNPGWYWYYADQAHAWNQVYFPKYGWLDFDMTISNEDAAEAPQPDGTPPTPPTNAHFVAQGTIQEIDTMERTMTVEVTQVLIKDEGAELEGGRPFELDSKKAKVYAGKESLAFNELQVGDSAVVVSFDEKINRLRRRRSWESVDDYLKKLPDPVFIQEIHVAPKKDPIEELAAEEDVAITEKVDQLAYTVITIIGAAIVLLFSAPFIHHRAMLSKINNQADLRTKSSAIYQHLHFLLNQLGMGRGSLTPVAYATELVDPRFDTHMEQFLITYQKLKYSNHSLTEEEVKAVEQFYPGFNRVVLSHFDFKQKFTGFLKINRWIHFLINLKLTN